MTKAAITARERAQLIKAAIAAGARVRLLPDGAIDFDPAPPQTNQGNDFDLVDMKR